MSDKKPEVWMRGAVDHVAPGLQPVVHSFLQVREEIEALQPLIRHDRLWARPGGAASVAFHLEHIGGATDRLLTYARGELLSADQFAALKAEGVDQNRSLGEIVERTLATLDRAIAQVAATSSDDALVARKVGRAGHPSTTLGLMFHAAEHATRHIGQATTTVKVLGNTEVMGAGF